MSGTTRARFRAAIVAAGAAVLLGGFFYHPYISRPTDEAAIATAAAANTTRWGLAHLVIGVGYGLAALAFIAIRSYLREAGGERWSIRALPFIVMGSTLFAVLTGMEFALLAAAETGGDVQGAQAAVMPWFVPIFLTGAISFALGAFGFANGIAHSGILGHRLTRLVRAGLFAMALARFVPLAPAPYVMATAGVVALWPLAYTMWRHQGARPAVQAQLTPAI